MRGLGFAGVDFVPYFSRDDVGVVPLYFPDHLLGLWKELSGFVLPGLDWVENV